MQRFLEYLYCCFESKPRYSKQLLKKPPKQVSNASANTNNLFRYPKNKESKNKIYFWKESMDKI